MLQRKEHSKAIMWRLSHNPIVAILGPRQVGKTTLSRMIASSWSDPVTHFDLENPRDLAALADPQMTLEPLAGLVILDEIQHLPEIFPLLRVLADRPGSSTRFLILGSASPDLLKQSSESLAGRISYYELTGFHLGEVGVTKMDDLWIRGGLPRSFLAEDLSLSDQWRRDFIQTFLERDLSQLGYNLPSKLLHRFWTMLAHSHGQVWNGSRLGESLGVSHTTVRSYLDALESTFLVRVLQPHLANISKRQVKAPKVYIRDSGLVHALLGLENTEDLLAHPVVGASWEGFALEQIIQTLGADNRKTFFWATHSGAELDLVVDDKGSLKGFECKRTLAPKITRSMRSALETLDLEELLIIYPGDRAYPLDPRVRVVPLAEFAG
jgi:predicted AAA+ superfamily ATPase